MLEIQNALEPHNNASPFRDPNMHSQGTSLVAFSDVPYKPEIAKEEAGLGVYLKDEANNHTIFVQVAARNVSSVL